MVSAFFVTDFLDFRMYDGVCHAIIITFKEKRSFDLW